MGPTVAAALAEGDDPYDAVAAAASEIAVQLGGAPDLCAVFSCGRSGEEPQTVIDAIAAELGPANLIGASAGGVIAEGREIERGSATSIWAARLPGARIETAHLQTGYPLEPFEAEHLPLIDERTEAVLVVGDPFSPTVPALLEHLNRVAPTVPVIGGLAAGRRSGPGPIFAGLEWFEGGAVVCSLAGVAVTPCVSQGATPVGPEMAVTALDGRSIAELASKPAMERIGEVISGLPTDERELAAHGLMLGIVVDENRPDHERGDFLVRPIVAADADSGSIMLGEQLRVGQTVRLHVRDRGTADRDLREALSLQVDAFGAEGAAGALMFSCNGRGVGMFGAPDHDASIADGLLAAPVAGCFCAGEIGPVAGRSFMHGFTATMAVFGAS